MSSVLTCGDCIAAMRKMDAESVDLLLTDPPYRTITGGDSGDRPKGMLSGNRLLFPHQYDVSARDWMPEAYRVLRNGTHAYVFTNFLNLADMMHAAKDAGFGLHNLLVWEKNNKTPSQFYMKNCEYVLFMRKGMARYVNDIGGSSTVHRFGNVIGCKTHPCEKPVDLLKFYLRNSAERGKTVLDPFMGTGSCGVACAELGMDFIGIEADEAFFSVAERKIREAEGKGNAERGEAACVQPTLF